MRIAVASPPGPAPTTSTSYSIASRGPKQQADGTGHKIAEALTAASTGAYQAVLKPIEGTILTVVRESAEAAKRASTDGGSLVDVLRAAQKAGKQALDNTPELLPVLKDAGVVDAGGAGYLLLLDSAATPLSARSTDQSSAR